MTKVIYESVPERMAWRDINPIAIVSDLARYRDLIVSMTLQNFRATYRASYLGASWQILLPLIMLAIFYYVFGVILGGKFAQGKIESPLDYALALFVGLGFFNFVAQNIGSATSLVISNSVYVKSLSFPLEVISLTSVLNSLLTLVINLLLTAVVLLVANKGLHLSAVLALFYLACIFMIALGISWALSAIAVVVRDVSAMVSPITIILMFMCPIFYPASMVPAKLKWIVNLNPIALIIEDVRGCLLYGRWPELKAVIYVFTVSVTFAVFGYFFFVRSKKLFADLI